MAMNQVIPGITSPNKLTIPVASRDHIQGLIDAPISLLEYGDYECPACGQAYRVVKAVQQSLGNSLCFAFRNFPLTTIHPHAEHAAEAAEAAAAQGNFWEMHDLLFEKQNALGRRGPGQKRADIASGYPPFYHPVGFRRILGTRKGRCSERP